MWILRWILLIIVLFFLVGFLSQNADQIVSVRIMGWTSPDLPLSYALFLAGLAGYALCLLVALINQIRLRTQIGTLRKQNRELQSELDRLRNFALEGEFPAVEAAPSEETRT
ncbi:LapA family protein [candidate division KSB1 bacterium]|nr:MAG: LapA family protein [candidate division KSB1 bacterium]